jgi:hypothetical protein
MPSKNVGKDPVCCNLGFSIQFFEVKYRNIIILQQQFLNSSLYLHEILNSVISLQIMLFKSYNIDIFLFGHQIYYIKPQK